MILWCELLLDFFGKQICAILTVNRNSEGQIRMLNAVPWHGQVGFRSKDFKDWFVVDPKGGERLAGKLKVQGKLALAIVDDAGHEVPFYQPEAIVQLIARWLMHPKE